MSSHGHTRAKGVSQPGSPGPLRNAKSVSPNDQLDTHIDKVGSPQATIAPPRPAGPNGAKRNWLASNRATHSFDEPTEPTRQTERQAAPRSKEPISDKALHDIVFSEPVLKKVQSNQQLDPIAKFFSTQAPQESIAPTEDLSNTTSVEVEPPSTSTETSGKKLGASSPKKIALSISSLLGSGPTMIRRVLLLLLVLALVSVGLVGVIGSSAPSTSTIDDPYVLIENLIYKVGATKDIEDVSGAYVAGVGIVLQVHAKQFNADTAATWWANIAKSFVAVVPEALGAEQMVVTILGVRSPDLSQEQVGRTLIAPISEMAQPQAYKVVFVLTTPSPDNPVKDTGDTSAVPAPAATNASETASVDTVAQSTVEVAPTEAAPTASPEVVATTEAATTTLATASAVVGGPLTTVALVAATTAPTATLASATTSALTTSAPKLTTISTMALKADALSTPPAKAAAGGAVVGKVISSTLTENFDGETTNWKTLSGQWKFNSGAYQQLDNTGFDYITQLTPTPGPDFAVSVTIKAIEGDPNGGLLLFQQRLGRRDEATMVDLSSAGSFVRWGHYVAGGGYNYDGGSKLLAPIDTTKGGVLKVAIKGSDATVFVDGKQSGQFKPFKTGGSLGLVTTQAKVAFDDFKVEPA